MNSYPLFVCGQMVLLESPELAAALSALSQMEQEIIFLYYFQRLTHREIGRRYGRAGNTTGRRIQMILRQLRAELEGLSYEMCIRDRYYIDHTTAIWPQAAGGIPFNACEFQSKGDAITDLYEDMAADGTTA